jgi:hypothetical protein
VSALAWNKRGPYYYESTPSGYRIALVMLAEAPRFELWRVVDAEERARTGTRLREQFIGGRESFAKAIRLAEQHQARGNHAAGSVA